MADLVWTREAKHWLKDIYDYIALDDPEAARSVVEGIFDRAQQLSEFPASGYRYEGSSKNVRILLYGHYRIAYRALDNEIIILGVFHGALAIERYLA